MLVLFRVVIARLVTNKKRHSNKVNGFINNFPVLVIKDTRKSIWPGAFKEPSYLVAILISCNEMGRVREAFWSSKMTG